MLTCALFLLYLNIILAGVVMAFLYLMVSFVL